MLEFSPEAITIVVSVVAVAIMGVMYWRTGKLLGAAEATNSAQELTETALTGARAAEQLWRSGKIMRDERLGKAIEHVKQWFPDLDEDSIITAVESAVLVVNTLVGRKV